MFLDFFEEGVLHTNKYIQVFHKKKSNFQKVFMAQLKAIMFLFFGK